MNPARAVFADTFYWIAIFNERDSRHKDAIAFSQANTDTIIITTDEVLTEFLAYFSGDLEARIGAAEVVGDILEDANVRVVEQSRESFLKGLELYKARPDKGYSLTDCISMNTMRAEGVADVLTNDVHFTQEGFRALFGA